jgi:hypothetical protein
MRAHARSRSARGSEVDRVSLQIASHPPGVTISNLLGTYSLASVGAAPAVAGWPKTIPLVRRRESVLRPVLWKVALAF